jgi:hypothetical protein
MEKAHEKACAVQASCGSRTESMVQDGRAIHVSCPAIRTFEPLRQRIKVRDSKLENARGSNFKGQAPSGCVKLKIQPVPEPSQIGE